MSDSESLPPGSVSVAPGDVLAGKYRVERILGVGGMGIVVAATHLQLDQRVALKFMLAQGMKQGPLVERFTREARAAVRLKSDHVARVLDVGVLETGSPYMVMEYLEGDDLGNVLEKRGPLGIEAAVDYVLQACDAVAEAHSLGIVHRDLKPRNLFLTRRNDGRALVKVLDFGISKQRSATDLSLTRTTEIIGSPNYMSPEQFRAARAADERSDIWALGVILYELVAGQVPFVADTVTQLTAMVLSEPPRPIHELRNSVPEEFVRVVDTCLQKDPAARFQSVARLAHALQRFAPPDARDLAARIARIGGGSSAGTEDPAGPAQVTGSRQGTPSTWAGARSVAGPTSRRAKVALTVAIVGLVGGALGVGLKLAMPRIGPAASDPKGTPAAARPAAEPSGAMLAPAAPVPPLSATLSPAPMPVAPPPPASTQAPPQAATPAPRGGPAPQRPPRGTGDAGGQPTSDEPPRYRTNW